MFTVGIFTTHFPYIAFVMFYAYFFLFGVNKVSSGEIQIADNYHKTELYANKHFQRSQENTYHFNSNNLEIFKYSEFEEILFRRKIVFPVFPDPEYNQNCFYNSLFCRPPPMA